MPNSFRALNSSASKSRTNFRCFFDPVQLTANFRTASTAGRQHQRNLRTRSFAVDDGSDVSSAEAQPARDGTPRSRGLHLVAEPSRACSFTSNSCRNRGNSRGLDVAEKTKSPTNAKPPAKSRLERDRRTHPRHIQMARPQDRESARVHRKNYRIAVLGRTRKALAPIALALRDADIPFRAVELEKLKHRPEIIDALALGPRASQSSGSRGLAGRAARAVVRPFACRPAPLTSADDAELLAPPVPELLAERANLLSAEGREAVERVLDAIEFAERLRSAQPTAALGTWLEASLAAPGRRAMRRRDGTRQSRSALEQPRRLPQGEPDLLGPALDAALDKLTALPDPAAESDFGVQLMTIHKAKGLEFEVVIVPDLQAGAGSRQAAICSPGSNAACRRRSTQTS